MIYGFSRCENATIQGDDDRMLVVFLNWLHTETPILKALWCSQSYAINIREVVMEWKGLSPGSVRSISNTSYAEVPLGVTNLQITPHVMYCIGNGNILWQDKLGRESGQWWAMMNITGDWGNWDNYDALNDSYLIHVFRETYKSAVASAVRLNYLEPSEELISAKVDFEALRLTIADMPLRLMEGIIVGLLLLVLTLLLIQKKFYRAHPNYLTGLALTLFRSQDLSLLIQGLGSPSIKSLREALTTYHFSITSDGRIVYTELELVPSTQHLRPQRHDRISTRSRLAIESWRPLGLSLGFLVGLIISSLCLVAALEAFQQVSTRRNGIIEVHPDDYTKYWWLYFPTVVMALLGLGYGILDYALRSVYPYPDVRASDHNCQSLDSLIFNPFESISILILTQAIKHRKYALIAGATVSLLSPLLTVVASGLFTTSLMRLPDASSQLRIDGWFDFRRANLSTMSDDGTTPPESYVNYNLAIQYNNLSFPRGSYDELAFASVYSDTIGHTYSKDDTVLQVRLPATQLRPNCTVLDDGYSRPYNFPPGVNMTVRARPPLGCKPPSIANSTWSGHSNEFELVLSPSNLGVKYFFPDSGEDGYFGTHVYSYWHQVGNTSDNQSGEYILTTPTTTCEGDARQHFFFFYGFGSDSGLPILTHLHCVPYVEALYVDATVNLQSLSVITDGSYPLPSPVEESRRIWEISGIPQSSLEFPSIGRVMGVSSFFDLLFETLGSAVNGVPYAELMDPKNTQLMLRKFSHVWAQLAAQILNFKYRNSTTTTNLTTLLSASGTTSDFVTTPVQAQVIRESTRLVQSNISTRLLQGLIILLLTCATISFATAYKSAVLPLNPATIAAQLSLMIDSGLVGKFVEVEQRSRVDMK
jgi:hypothetical protein